jgi:RimJ/RimL family protein N-acetyltransferase
MSEALDAMVEFAFSTQPDGLNLTRLGWFGFAGNLPSARVAEKAGFRFEGIRRLAMPGRNGLEDIWIAGLLNGDERPGPTRWPVFDQ